MRTVAKCQQGRKRPAAARPCSCAPAANLRPRRRTGERFLAAAWGRRQHRRGAKQKQKQTGARKQTRCAHERNRTRLRPFHIVIVVAILLERFGDDLPAGITSSQSTGACAVAPAHEARRGAHLEALDKVGVAELAVQELGLKGSLLRVTAARAGLLHGGAGVRAQRAVRAEERCGDACADQAPAGLRLARHGGAGDKSTGAPRACVGVRCCGPARLDESAESAAALPRLSRTNARAAQQKKRMFIHEAASKREAGIPRKQRGGGPRPRGRVSS